MACDWIRSAPLLYCTNLFYVLVSEMYRLVPLSQRTPTNKYGGPYQAKLSKKACTQPPSLDKTSRRLIISYSVTILGFIDCNKWYRRCQKETKSIHYNCIGLPRFKLGTSSECTNCCATWLTPDLHLCLQVNFRAVSQPRFAIAHRHLLRNLATLPSLPLPLLPMLKYAALEL